MWSLDSSTMGPQGLQGLLGCPAAAPGPVARDQGRRQGWPQLVLCMQLAVWASAGGHAAAGPHTHSGEDPGRKQGPGPLQAHWTLLGPGVRVQRCGC